MTLFCGFNARNCLFEVVGSKLLVEERSIMADVVSCLILFCVEWDRSRQKPRVVRSRPSRKAGLYKWRALRANRVIYFYSAYFFGVDVIDLLCVSSMFNAFKREHFTETLEQNLSFH